jgi:hypothetical protein
MTKVRLCSGPMIHTPGVIAWAKNGYQFPRDRKNMVKVITESFGLTPECAHDLLSGRVECSIYEDNVEFDYDGEAVA